MDLLSLTILSCVISPYERATLADLMLMLRIRCVVLGSYHKMHYEFLLPSSPFLETLALGTAASILGRSANSY